MRKSKIAVVAAVAAMGAGSAVAAGLGVTNYVQDGLVVQFDGIDNEATGVHNPNATKWIACKSSATLTPTGNGAFGASYFGTTRQTQTISGAPDNIYTHSLTMEMAINLVEIGRLSGEGSVWPFLYTAGTAAMHGTGNEARYMRFYVNNQDPRPNSYILYTNTVTGVSDASSRRIYRDGTLCQSVDPVKTTATKLSTGWTLNNGASNGSTFGFISTRFHAIRAYDRALTGDELQWNSMIDQLRFWAPRCVGDGTACDWNGVAWVNAENGAVGAPSTATNGCASVVNATMNVAAADAIGLKALSLEDGAKLALAEDVIVAVKVLFVEGKPIARGIYTGGDGTAGEKADWIVGAGQVRVAGSIGGVIPSLVMAPAADGWYEVGDGEMNVEWSSDYKTKGYGQAACPVVSGNRQFVRAQFVDWNKYGIPVGSKLRIRGGVLMNALPSASFSEIDLSAAKRIVFFSDRAFDDGRTFTIPAGDAFMRWMPGVWKQDPASGSWWMTNFGDAWTSHKFVSDLVINGALMHRGDNTHLNPEWFTGSVLGGTGEIQANSFSQQVLFDCDSFDYSGTMIAGSNGTCIEVRANSVKGEIRSFSMADCASQALYRTNTQYCASGLRFGPKAKDSGATALKIASLNGRASDYTGADGKRWRIGGHIIVWGGNTVHVGTLQSSLHVVALKGDQNCVCGRFNDTAPFGTGNVIFDTINDKANLYLSTNVFVKVGTVVGNTCFNYTYQSNAVNRMTLDITDTCSPSAQVHATDLQMLPARLSGFKGTITLRDIAANNGKTYEMPLDFDKELYTTEGCIGSGTLANAPARGVINVTLSGTPKKGKFSLFRFDNAVAADGSPLFKDWTVVVDGKEVTDSISVGSGENLKVATVKRDATGIWLNVALPGLKIIMR